MPAEDLPAIPARMVNQYVFCPRYFYLAWVDQRRVHNDNTLEGEHVHRVVDRPRGNPDDLPSGRITSLDVTSDALGFTAKIDVVQDHPDSGLVAVDVKSGQPMPDGSAWPGDLLQATAGAIALRDSGFPCHHAGVWYARTRQLIQVEVTSDLEQQLVDTLKAMREVARARSPPPPLVASRWCATCTLVGICLPDETNTVLTRGRELPRQLVPRDPDQQPVHVTEQGATVGARRGRLVLSKDGQTLLDMRLLDVSTLSIHGNVQISAPVMRELFTREIPVLWFSYGGFQGMATGLPGKSIRLRAAQFRVDPTRALHAATRMVYGKIRNCRTLLRRNAKAPVAPTIDALAHLASSACDAGSAAELLGIGEPPPACTSRRTPSCSPPTAPRRRLLLPVAQPSPADGPDQRLPVQAYSLLERDLTVTVAAVGLDPYQGVFHRPRFGRPALALDLAEEFRPLIADSVVIGTINNREIDLRHFDVRARGVQLTREGRRALIAAYERRLSTKVRHPLFGYKISYRRVLDVQTRLLAAFLVDEFDEYRPFTTR